MPGTPYPTVRREPSVPSGPIPQLMIRRGWMRMTSRLMYELGGSWPVRASAVPRTSKQRGVHGLTEARSSTTNATLPLAPTLRNLRVLPRSRPRMLITPASASTWNPTGLFCSVPSGASVARRPRRWDRRYSSSASVNITPANLLLRPGSAPPRRGGQVVRLGEAVPVSGVVPDDRFDAVGAHGRLLQELDAERGQRLVVPAAVRRSQHARAQRPLGDQGTYLVRGRGVEHRMRRVHQQEFLPVAALRADGQPAHAVLQLEIVGQLAAQFRGVELLGRVLVQHPDRDERHSHDHGDSLTVSVDESPR